MGKEISTHREELAQELDGTSYDVQLYRRDRNDDLHDQHHRGLSPTDSKGDQDQRRILKRESLVHTALPGSDADEPKVDQST